MVIPSLSGTTKESIAGAAHARTAGRHGDLSLDRPRGHAAGREADHSFVNFAEDDTSCESFYLQSLLVALSIMDHRGEIAGP